MKTYQSKTKDGKKNFFVRHKYAVTVVISTLIVAAVIVLSIVFTLPKESPSKVQVDPPTVDVDTKPEIVLPMKNATIGIGYEDKKIVKWETLDLWQWHPAVDFVGAGDVVCIMNGKVTKVENTSMDGNVVTVEHDGGYVSVYKSLGNTISVKEGDEVKAGAKIGVSSTSMASERKTGDHLHFELKKDGKYVDPATLLPMEGDK